MTEVLDVDAEEHYLTLTINMKNIPNLFSFQLFVSRPGRNIINIT